MNQIKKQGIVILLFFPLFSFSCDICGNYMGLTPYDNKNIVSFLHRYRVYNGYRNYQTQGHFFPTGAYKVNHQSLSDSLNLKQNHSSKDFESYKIFELRLKYFITKRIELNFFVPFINNKSRNDGVFVSNTGLADISVFAGYHIIKAKSEGAIKHKLIFNGGLKLATGNHIAHDANINRLPFEMQAGSGSYDVLIGINYLCMIKRFGLNANANFKWNGKNNYSEQLAPSTTNFMSLFYKVTIKKVALYPTVLCNYEFTKGLYTKNTLDKATAVNSLLIGPGVEVYYKNAAMNASCQFTLYENQQNNQLKNVGRLTVGINYSFENKKK